MLVLALDTTTRAGSLAIARDGELLETWSGDAALTHAARLPGEIVEGLERHHLTLRDIDLYGVASGPGSFTGLRIGIATIQGLAFAHRRSVVGVSALDALAWTTRDSGGNGWVAAWMDARRGEVFAGLYRVPPPSAGDLSIVAGPEVDLPGSVLSRWAEQLGEGEPVIWTGDGALAYRPLLETSAAGRPWRIMDEVPRLAPAIAALAALRAGSGTATSPHAVRPLYVRRPDAELARDRRQRENPASAGGDAA